MKHNVLRLSIGAALIATSAIVAGGAARATTPDDAPEIDCEAIAVATETPPELTTFIELGDSVDGGSLADVEGEITVFVPVNAAFEAIPQNVFDAIVADDHLVDSILTYHVIAGRATVADLAEARAVDTVNGAPLTAALNEAGILTINDAAVLCAELDLGGNFLYVIDTVLQPPRGADAPTGSSVPGSSVPGASVPGSSVPAEFDADQQAVADAWQTAVDSSSAFDVVAPLVEDADAIRATIEAYPTAAQMVQGITAKVTSVTIDGDTAFVLYVIAFNDVEAPYGELETTLVNIDGTWIVPQDEYCAVMAYARNNCPAA